MLSDLHHSISDEQKTNDAYLGPHIKVCYEALFL